MSRPTPDVIIFVVPEILSDGSKVFNIHIGDVKLHAVTEDDAGTLAENFAELIEDHTNDTAGVVYQ